MKKLIALTLTLVITCFLLGQEKLDKEEQTQQSVWLKEGWIAAESNYVDAFTHAFKDPNILIGVFDCPEILPYDTTLSSGEKLCEIPGFWESLGRFTVLVSVKPIKGKFNEPVIFVYTFPLVYRVPYDRPQIPWFFPPRGSKWVLALEKTSKEFRTARFSEEIEKYKFLNNNTLFMPFRYGSGTLCLKWPEKDEMLTEPSYLMKVPELVVEDLEAIQSIFTYTQKEEKDPNEMAAINNVSKELKTNAAKSIFAKLLSGEPSKVLDPNEGK